MYRLPNTDILTQIFTWMSNLGSDNPEQAFFANRGMLDRGDFARLTAIQEATQGGINRANLRPFEAFTNFLQQNLGISSQVTGTIESVANAIEPMLGGILPEHVLHALSGPEGNPRIALRNLMENVVAGQRDAQGNQLGMNQAYTTAFANQFQSSMANMRDMGLETPNFARVSQITHALRHTGLFDHRDTAEITQAAQLTDAAFGIIRDEDGRIINAQDIQLADSDSGEVQRMRMAMASAAQGGLARHFTQERDAEGNLQFRRDDDGRLLLSDALMERLADAGVAHDRDGDFDQLFTELATTLDDFAKRQQDLTSSFDALIAQADSEDERESLLASKLDEIAKLNREQLAEQKKIVSNGSDHAELLKNLMDEEMLGGANVARTTALIQRMDELERPIMSKLQRLGAPADMLTSQGMQQYMETFFGGKGAQANINLRTRTMEDVAQYLSLLTDHTQGMDERDRFMLAQRVSAGLQGTGLERFEGKIQLDTVKQLVGLTHQGASWITQSNVLGQADLAEIYGVSLATSLQHLDSDMANVLGTMLRAGDLTQQDITALNEGRQDEVLARLENRPAARSLLQRMLNGEIVRQADLAMVPGYDQISQDRRGVRIATYNTDGAIDLIHTLSDKARMDDVFTRRGNLMDTREQLMLSRLRGDQDRLKTFDETIRTLGSSTDENNREKARQLHDIFTRLDGGLHELTEDPNNNLELLLDEETGILSQLHSMGPEGMRILESWGFEDFVGRDAKSLSPEERKQLVDNTRSFVTNYNLWAREGGFETGTVRTATALSRKPDSSIFQMMGRDVEVQQRFVEQRLRQRTDNDPMLQMHAALQDIDVERTLTALNPLFNATREEQRAMLGALNNVNEKTINAFTSLQEAGLMGGEGALNEEALKYLINLTPQQFKEQWDALAQVQRAAGDGDVTGFIADKRESFADLKLMREGSEEEAKAATDRLIARHGSDVERAAYGDGEGQRLGWGSWSVEIASTDTVQKTARAGIEAQVQQMLGDMGLTEEQAEKMLAQVPDGQDELINTIAKLAVADKDGEIARNVTRLLNAVPSQARATAIKMLQEATGGGDLEALTGLTSALTHIPQELQTKVIGAMSQLTHTERVQALETFKGFSQREIRLGQAFGLNLNTSSEEALVQQFRSIGRGEIARSGESRESQLTTDLQQIEQIRQQEVNETRRTENLTLARAVYDLDDGSDVSAANLDLIARMSELLSQDSNFDRDGNVRADARQVVHQRFKESAEMELSVFKGDKAIRDAHFEEFARNDPEKWAEHVAKRTKAIDAQRARLAEITSEREDIAGNAERRRELIGMGAADRAKIGAEAELADMQKRWSNDGNLRREANTLNASIREASRQLTRDQEARDAHLAVTVEEEEAEKKYLEAKVAESQKRADATIATIEEQRKATQTTTPADEKTVSGVPSEIKLVGAEELAKSMDNLVNSISKLDESFLTPEKTLSEIDREHIPIILSRDSQVGYADGRGGSQEQSVAEMRVTAGSLIINGDVCVNETAARVLPSSGQA